MLTLYATGLGTATVEIAPGLVFTGAYSLPQTPAVSVGGSAAEVVSAALIAPGLYQVTFRVPADLAPGDYEIVVTQGEAVSSAARILIEAKLKSTGESMPRGKTSGF